MTDPWRQATRLALVSLVSCAALLAPSAGADVVIHTDRGGDVSTYLRKLNELKRTHTRTWIYGPCGSACTLYLGLGTLACTTTHAKWQFHGPSGADGHTRLDPWVFEYTSKIMAEQYPPRLAEWFMTTGRHRTGKHFYTLTGSQIIGYGARACPMFAPQ